MRCDPFKALFYVSACLASFGYGIATVHCQIFPFTLLQNANRALHAVSAPVAVDEDSNLPEVHRLSAPSARQFSDGAGEELILVTGGPGWLEEHNPENGCLAWIMDRQGHVRHIWKHDPEVWANPEKIAAIPGMTPVVYPVGVHLYPDGGLLVAYQGKQTFPFGVGLARFDRDSNLLWKKELLNHHWFTVAADGRIFALALRPVDTPYRLGETRYSISAPDGKMLKDLVMVLDPDGNVLDEIPIVDAFVDSGLTALLQMQVTTAENGSLNNEQFTITSNDPTHLNGIQLVDAEVAGAHPWLNEGDLLISMRFVNSVAILDPKTRRIKWISTGTAFGPHSPRFYEGQALCFDNRGGAASTGGSQLVQIDLETRMPRVVFPQPSVALPGDFYSSAAGYIDMGHSDRALVALTFGQKIWELNLKTGEVLWEYICVDPKHRQRLVQTARYVHEANFPMNREAADTQ